MVTRVQLDVSHVSRGVTIRREKVIRYIRNSNELLRYVRLEHFFTLLRTLEYTERVLARFHEFSFSLLVFGDSVTDLSGATLSFSGSCGESRCERRKLVWCKADPEGKTFDVARPLHSSQPAGSSGAHRGVV